MTYTIVLATPAGAVYAILRKFSPERTWTLALDRLAAGRWVFVWPNYEPNPRVQHECDTRSWAVH